MAPSKDYEKGSFNDIIQSMEPNLRFVYISALKARIEDQPMIK